VDGPRLSSPNSGGTVNSFQPPAWRSQHAADAAVPLDARRPPTVVWSPVGFTLFHLGVPNIELDADTWRSYDDWAQAQAGSCPLLYRFEPAGWLASGNTTGFGS
jgi:hypothetical protein